MKGVRSWDHVMVGKVGRKVKGTQCIACDL